MPFKIRRKDPVSGEYFYSSGGSNPIWRKGPAYGKVWKNIGQVKNHLNMFNEWSGNATGKNKVPKDWEVVECELTLIERGAPQNAHDLVQPKVDKDRLRQLEWKRRYEEQEKAQLKQLKAKYPEEK